MSQADALLASLAETTSANPDTEARIVIGEDRFITVPDSLKRIAVQYDHNIETVTFECPRYWDKHDMSQMKIYINYMRPNETTGQALADNVSVKGSKMYFDWTITRNVTQYKGKISFLVCIKKTDADGNEANHWGSELCQECYISEGLECTQTVISRYPDIITQLLTRMDSVEALATPEAMQAYAETWLEENKDSVLSEIQTKGEEVLASLPEDYSTVAAWADEGAHKKAAAIMIEAEGESVFVNDSSDAYLPGLNLYGKTTQVTTTGAQLVDFNEGITATGVTATFVNDTLIVTGDGTLPYQSWSKDITASITEHPDEVISINYDELKLASDHDGSIAQLNIENTDGTHVYHQMVTVSGYKKTYTVPSDTSGIKSVHLAVYTTNSATSKANTVKLIKPILYYGTEVKTYEPYSGGVASPSPDWPQELNSIENPTISLFNSNIFDIDSVELTTNTSLTVSDDKYTITAVGGTVNIYAHSGYRLPSYLLNAIRGRTVYLAADSITTDNENSMRTCVQLNIVMDDGSAQYASVREGRLAVSADIPQNVKTLEVNIYTSNYGTKLETDVTGVFKGLRLTVKENIAWEPFKEVQTLPINYTLPGIPVTSGGNYTDSNGQQWICDEIDFERGVYVQRVMTTVVTATPEFNETADYPGRFSWFCLSENYKNGREVALCNFGRWNTWGFSNGETDCGAVSGNQMYYSPINSMSADEVNAMFSSMIESGNPPTVIAQLTTPIETPLTAEELANFKMVRSHYHNTTVLNDAGAHMAVKYNADTKIYVDSAVIKYLSENPISGDILTDTETGKSYQLVVIDGKLALASVET